MKTNEFDCVELQYEGGRRVMKELRGLSKEQRLEFWRKATEELRARQEKLKKAKRGTKRKPAD
ncbi:MAG: hypothetical protein HRF49_01540 [bacterium]|jgi:hypothetical protein